MKRHVLALREHFIIAYRFDDDGRLSHKTLPDGQTLRYHYEQTPGHTRGNLTAITRETLFGLTQQTLVEQIDQDTGDGSGGYVASNGLRTHHQYAANGSITAIDIDRVMNLVYEFDEQGRIVGIDGNGTLRRYGYSRLGLTMAQSDGEMYRFDYDSMGNRRASSVEGSDGALSATLYDYPERGQGNRERSFRHVIHFAGDAPYDLISPFTQPEIYHESNQTQPPS